MAVEGTDYDIERFTWLWDVSSIADKTIINHNQKGVNSKF
jgi:Rieske 2Fe-2S family protein